MRKLSVILLAGGKGTRMMSAVPKQYLKLSEKPIALYSFNFFLSIDEVSEIVVVCEPEFRHLFQSQDGMKVLFADPGSRRQDSVRNGLDEIRDSKALVCVHDAARPFLKKSFFVKALEEARLHEAVAIGTPVKSTIKEVDDSGFVVKTLNRSHIWEIQTPQFLTKELLENGFEIAHKENLTVTDDVSLAELQAHPVKLVEGCYTNIKITTPEDLLLAEQILEKIQHH